ncbi:MAG: Ig-like domain-containing protein, partial [Phycisphaeraceae bacterium JB051]
PQYYRFALQHQTMAADRDSDVHTQTGQTQVTIASSHQNASVDAGMLDPNHAPQAAPNFVVVDYQQATDIDVLSNDYDADGDSLFVSQLSGETTARGASITINDDNTIHYDPSGLFDALEPGQKIRDRFRYEVTDAWGKSDTHIVFVDVRRPLASENQGNEGQGDDGVVIVAQSTPPRFIAVSGISSDPFDIASLSQVDRVALAWLSQQASMSVVPQAGSSLATQQPWLTALLDNHDDQKGQFNWRLTQTEDEQSV